MDRVIRIKVGDIALEAMLNDSRTARAIWDALPVRAMVSTWGDEIYFSIPVEQDLENAREVVGAGDLGYWPPGQAFCIFFGPTPASRGEEIRPASAVNVFGKVSGDATVLRQVKPGTQITVERKAWKAFE